MGLRIAGIVVFAAAGCCAAGCALRPPADTYAAAPPARLAAERPIAVVGDLQMTSRYVRFLLRRESNIVEQKLLIEDLHARAHELEALVIVGDLVFSPASRAHWRHFDGLVGPIARKTAVLPAIGNHDYYCVLVQRCMQRVVPQNFLRRFPWFAPGRPYTVEYGDVMLAFLDSETNLAGQGAWLELRLREWEAAYSAVVVFLHRAPFTESVTRGMRADAAVQAHIAARLTGTSLVPVVVAGHIHGYEHLVIDGVHYVTTAGGGGPRGLLGAERPHDVYAGRDCARDAYGRVRRPFNYVLIERRDDVLAFTVRGFCRGDGEIDVVESFDVALPAIAAARAEAYHGRDARGLQGSFGPRARHGTTH